LVDRLLTIGAYGFTADSFLAALRSAEATALIDVRMRRGMRGSAYAWANATRLRSLLEAQGVRYGHARNLAPTAEIRSLQRARDATEGAAKRSRVELDPAFVEAYRRVILRPLDAATTLRELQAIGQVPVLFCVEALPAACHRSLVAEWVSERLPVIIEHLAP
jgi:uncharacterized protein (DUF488 family)